MKSESINLLAKINMGLITKTKRINILILLMGFVFSGLSQNLDVGKITSVEDSFKKMKWFQQARFGMFIHYGLYSGLEGYWKNNAVKGIGEWILKHAEIPVKEYQQLAKNFNPVQLNPEAWVKLAKETGMKYIVLTTKHHDGFALFDSEHYFNVVDSTPYEKDIVAQFVKACNKHGLKLGFYYSQNQDWTYPGAQGNNWDSEYSYSKEGFEYYMKSKAIPQIKELLTKYGEIDMIWFDTPYKMTKEESQAFLNVSKQLQPQIIVSGRIGNELGDYVQMEDNSLPKTRQESAWEVPVTMNHTWAYKRDDNNWKSTKYLLWQLTHSVAMNGNYLLNIGPKGDGSVPQASLDTLQQIGKWMQVNKKAIEKASPSPFKQAFRWGSITQQPGKLYLNISDWPKDNTLAIHGLNTKIKCAQFLSDGKQIKTVKEGDYTIFHLPKNPTDPYVSVLEVELDGILSVEDVLAQNYDGTIQLETEAATNTTGAKIRFGALTMYRKPKGTLSWDFKVNKTGRYKIEIITTGRKKMATPTAFALFDEGHEIEVTVNQNSFNYIIEKHYEEKAPKDLYNTFKVTSLSEFNLTKGMNSITLKALKINFKNQAGFSLRQIRLIPIP